MSTIGRVLFLGDAEDNRTRRYTVDTVLALVPTLAVTAFIYLEHLYPRIPNISLLYLLVVLVLASTRGLYAAIVASVVAFFSFDFFLVQPLFTFTIGRFEEWLALSIFLVTAITTGRLASGLRQRAEQALLRASETQALYELVNATTREESLERQLNIVASSIVSHFSGMGVQDCAILLPDRHRRLTVQADACQPAAEVALSSDEMRSAETLMTEGRVVDVYVHADTPVREKLGTQHYTRTLSSGKKDDGEQGKQRYVRLLPLQLGTHVLGVVRLLMEESARKFPVERPQGARERVQAQAAFFWTFLDQATAMIERARLHRETMQIELLQRTDALRSALLSSVSHDLRTPLASIKAAASSLLQEDVQWNEEERRGFASAIERQADRLNRLVSNLLDMSRIEGGAIKPEKEWYPLDDLLHDVLDHMQGVLQEHEIRVDIADNLPPVELDYLQIDQVVTNLLENAARYTPPSSPLEILVQVQEDAVLVSIADRGPGIPPGDLERIFDKFYRVSGTARRNSSIMGTGLGLAVCRGLIEAHGGRIWAENRPGGGAVFQFTLPLTAAEMHESLENGVDAYKKEITS